MKMNQRFNLVLWMVLLLYTGNAQLRFSYNALTDSVAKDGFYKISLSPSITAKCKPALEDIRLLDNGEKQVPYFIKNNERVFEEKELIPLKITDKLTDHDSVTTLLVENITNGKVNLIDNIVFVFQNSMVNRSINISGSSDQVRWYAIGEYISLEKRLQSNTEHITQIIPLPLVRYPYFLIKFNVKRQDPVLIERAGTYISKQQAFEYSQLPAPKMIQRDSSDKKSYLQLIFTEKYNTDKIELFPSGTKFFERKFLFAEDQRKGENETRVETISSKKTNEYPLHLQKTDTIRLEIYNDDNPPIHIDSVKVYQNAQSLFAYLNAGQRYWLAFGNDSLQAPVYDIAAFSDSAGLATPVLNTGMITVSNLITPTEPVVTSGPNKLWLWAVIIAVLGLLLYFTASMAKQINKKAGG